MKGLAWIICCAGVLCWGCIDEGLDDGSGPWSEPTTTNGKFNDFLREKMTDIYLWADDARAKAGRVPVDTSNEAYLDAMRYHGDPWSRLTGEAFDGEAAEIDDGYDTGCGWVVTVWTITHLGTKKIKLNYVYPGSPADKKGLKRGDFISRIDGRPVEDGNLYRLFSTRETVRVTVEPGGGGDDREVEVVPARFDVNPVGKVAVLPVNGARVGYLYYSSFVYTGDKASLEPLTEAFRYFKKQGLTDFVLDLRYNGGGYLNAAIHLASLLAPEKQVTGRDVLIRKTWNAEYEKKNKDDKADHFDPDVPADARLGLSRLWVLTSQGTASASEVVISGLSPYMDVRVVGDITAGKYTGGSIFTPPADAAMKGKAVYLITMSYKNSRGESVEGGIVPRIGYDANEINELFEDTRDLGDPGEFILSRALADITGKRSRTVVTPASVDGPRGEEVPVGGRLVVGLP
jgi:C-terminal processing protease CtpA/Prc